MESIKLTEEHKSKLLEMCKALFPEMYFGFNIIPTVGVEHEGLYYYPTPRSRKKRYIHWFEFCFIYLSEAVQHALPEEKVWSIMPPYAGGDGVRRWTMWSKFHYLYPKACKGFSSDGEYDLPSNPVEYLYEQFKSLKT